MNPLRTLGGLIATFSLLFAIPGYAAADKISDGQWFLAFLRTSEAHAIAQGDGVMVGVVDTGVDGEHPALSGSVIPGTDLTGPGDGTTDRNGHGTFMAGLIVAHTTVNGLSPKAKVLAIRTHQGGDGGSASTAQGIIWAAQNGAKVISISSTSKGGDSRLDFAVQEAAKADAVVVAAVGNRPDDSSVGYPAAIPGVLAVASVDRNGNHAPNSVTGPEVVISAPGTDISSTTINGGYSVTSGTSNATAIVAGAVALVRAKFPQLKAQEVIRRITATATDKGAPGRDNEYGYGVLNLVAALTADLPAPTTAAPASSPVVTPSAPAVPSKPGFPWWLVALPVAFVLGVAGFVVIRRKR